MWVFSLIAYQTFGSKLSLYADKYIAFHTVYRFCLGDFDFDALVSETQPTDALALDRCHY
jgi:hypothetical protein